MTACSAQAQGRVQPQVQGGSSAWKPPQITIQAQSNLVPLQVVVRGADGRVIAGLGRERFRVSDDGHVQMLSQFFVERTPGGAASAGAKAAQIPTAKGPAGVAAAPPRYVALWLDDVNTQGSDLQHARNAALDFLRRGVGPGDRVGLFTTSGTQQISFTADVAQLEQAIAEVRAHPRANPYGLRSSCPRITPYQAYEIVVMHFKEAFDAALEEKGVCDSGAVNDLTGKSIVALDPQVSEPILAQARATWERARAIGLDTQADIGAVVGALARRPGKRILLMASGGFYSETLDAGQERIVDEALRDHVVINALDAKGLYAESPVRPLGQESDAGVLPLITFFYDFASQVPAHQAENAAMVHLAQSTGGLFFHNSNDLALGFRRLGLMPAVTYELAFAPPSLPRDGKFHSLKVELTPPIKGAIIQARRGYYDPEPLTPAEQLGPALARAMQGNDQVSHVPVSVRVKPESGSVGVHVQFDVSRLTFTSAHGRRNQLLDMIAALYDSNGQFVTGQQGTIDLALDGSHYNHFKKSGLGAMLGLHAAAGTYRLRVAVAEASDGKLSTFTRTVTVH